MSFQTTAGGTRGARVPGPNAVTRAIMRVMNSWLLAGALGWEATDAHSAATVSAVASPLRTAPSM
jgi:hypothetical protein